MRYLISKSLVDFFRNGEAIIALKGSQPRCGFEEKNYFERKTFESTTTTATHF